MWGVYRVSIGLDKVPLWGFYRAELWVPSQHLYGVSIGPSCGSHQAPLWGFYRAELWVPSWRLYGVSIGPTCSPFAPLCGCTTFPTMPRSPISLLIGCSLPSWPLFLSRVAAVHHGSCSPPPLCPFMGLHYISHNASLRDLATDWLLLADMAAFPVPSGRGASWEL